MKPIFLTSNSIAGTLPAMQMSEPYDVESGSRWVDCWVSEDVAVVFGYEKKAQKAALLFSRVTPMERVEFGVDGFGLQRFGGVVQHSHGLSGVQVKLDRESRALIGESDLILPLASMELPDDFDMPSHRVSFWWSACARADNNFVLSGRVLSIMDHGNAYLVSLDDESYRRSGLVTCIVLKAKCITDEPACTERSVSAELPSEPEQLTLW